MACAPLSHSRLARASAAQAVRNASRSPLLPISQMMSLSTARFFDRCARVSGTSVKEGNGIRECWEDLLANCRYVFEQRRLFTCLRSLSPITLDPLQVVMTIAHTGPMGAAARDCLGKDPGMAVHVVLPEREDHPGNIGDFGADRDVKAGGVPRLGLLSAVIPL